MMMSNLIKEANKAYYNEDEKLITDQEFDLLEDHGLGIENFRSKTDHVQPMGSLKKIKTYEDFIRWVGRGAVKVTPKLDGNSIELVYKDGELIKAITRGDGFVGNDVTDKIAYCNIVDNPPKEKGIVSRKCEALMPKKYQANYEKNIRNIVAGTLNRKSIDRTELAKIHVVCFDEMLDCRNGYLEYADLEATFEEMKENYWYEIDGLVVELFEHVHEEKDELLPANIVALKFNKSGVDAEVGEIEINLGKHGKLTPVLILKDAVDIDGAMVQRVSASNYGILVAAGLGIGAKVQVIKSGDIIPFVSAVVEKSDNIPAFICPECDMPAEISENGIHATCPNELCTANELIRLQHIFKMLDLEFISERTVEKLYEQGYTTLQDFALADAAWIEKLPSFGKSKAANIVAKMKTVKFTEADVLKAAMVKGISSSQSKRLIEKFGSLENFLKGVTRSEIESINGMGGKLADIVFTNHHVFVSMFEEIKNCGFEIMATVDTSNMTTMNVVCTGTCAQYGRKELAKVLEEKGVHMQKAVNKDTNYLLTNDVNSNSSKAKKAQKLGVKIISYDDFFQNKVF
jgi:DNA ligase (NAD+)